MKAYIYKSSSNIIKCCLNNYNLGKKLKAEDITLTELFFPEVEPVNSLELITQDEEEEKFEIIDQSLSMTNNPVRTVGLTNAESLFDQAGATEAFSQPLDRITNLKVILTHLCRDSEDYLLRDDNDILHNEDSYNNQ